MTAVRDGIDESVHRGHVAVCGPDGAVLASVGTADQAVYVRSAAKPFQAAAVLDVADDAGVELDDAAVAICAASHAGSHHHQQAALRVLAYVGLDAAALRCPPALPADTDTLLRQRAPSALAHNCSGKHAGFLLAQVHLAADPAAYLDPGSRLQRRVAARLEGITGCRPRGPGVDGCGAPAWVLPLHGLATGFARLAAGADVGLARVREAMTAHPQLVGGGDAVDTGLMSADPRTVAKRGAEAVFAAGLDTGDGAVGVAVKIVDGGQRAAGPVAAAVLRALGATVPDRLVSPVVLGGGRPRGALQVSPAIATGLP